MTGDQDRHVVSHPHRNRFWFGTGLAQFLKAELKDFPERRVAALRLFVVSLAIALTSQSLHIPPLGAISLLVCLSYDAYANSGQALAFGLRQFGYLIVTTLISVFTLMFAGNDPWLLLCLTFVILALSLFHARLIAWPTGIALWFSIAVMYSPSTPDENIYNALWNIPIIGGLALGSWTVVHWVIKPKDPLKLLRAEIAAQLAAVEHVFAARLADSGVHSHHQQLTDYPKPGSFGKLPVLLANSELIHPDLRQYRCTYTALVLEIDGLRQSAGWLVEALAAEYRARSMTKEKLNVYLAMQSACAALRKGLDQGYDLSEQVDALLDDETLYRYSQHTNQSALAALWRGLQRISGLIRELHQPPELATRKRKIEQAESEEQKEWLPPWFGYEFWVAHSDSLQFGIKFSLGAVICMLIVDSLEWPDINTAIPTCLVAAQTSLGADYRLSMLRLSGATLGGLCAYFYVLAFQSQLDTIAGFTIATAPIWALAAWITAGSERIAYMGRQLGFSFALFVLHDFGAVTDLYLPRDRVIGILLGLVVMGVIDYALWPRRSIVLARHHAVSALRTLAKFTIRLPDASHLLYYILPLRLAAEKDLAAAQELIAHAVLEPDARLAQKIHERAALKTLIKATSRLSGLLQIRKRYRLLSGQQFGQFPEELQQYSRRFDADLANALEQAALALQGRGREADVEVAESQARLHRSYAEYHRIGDLPDDLAKEWELRFMLDRQIVELVERIEKIALKSLTKDQRSSKPEKTYELMGKH